MVQLKTPQLQKKCKPQLRSIRKVNLLRKVNLFIVIALFILAPEAGRTLLEVMFAQLKLKWQ